MLIDFRPCHLFVTLRMDVLGIFFEPSVLCSIISDKSKKMKCSPGYSLLIALLLFSCNGSDDGMVEPQIKAPDKVVGCTDPESLTYNPEANVSDGSCKYVEEKNTALLTFRTSTGCWACGSYGEESKKKIIDGAIDGLVSLSLHTEGSKLGNPLSLEVAASLLHLGGFPTYMINKTWWQGTDPEENAQTGLDHIAEFANQPVVAGMYGRYQINADKEISCEAWSKFFIASEGKFRIAVYVVEDEVMAGQAPTSYLEIPHYDVLRDVLSETLGTPINTESQTMSVGEVNSFEFSKKIETVLDQENIKVVGVLLKEMEDGRLSVVNSQYLERM